jgi:hypothetical protein
MKMNSIQHTAVTPKHIIIRFLVDLDGSLAIIALAIAPPPPIPAEMAPPSDTTGIATHAATKNHAHFGSGMEGVDGFPLFIEWPSTTMS